MTDLTEARTLSPDDIEKLRDYLARDEANVGKSWSADVVRALLSQRDELAAIIGAAIEEAYTADQGDSFAPIYDILARAKALGVGNE